jgi:hypothetical protein
MPVATLRMCRTLLAASPSLRRTTRRWHYVSNHCERLTSTTHTTLTNNREERRKPVGGGLLGADEELRALAHLVELRVRRRLDEEGLFIRRASVLIKFSS